MTPYLRPLWPADHSPQVLATTHQVLPTILMSPGITNRWLGQHNVTRNSMAKTWPDKAAPPWSKRHHLHIHWYIHCGDLHLVTNSSHHLYHNRANSHDKVRTKRNTHPKTSCDIWNHRPNVGGRRTSSPEAETTSDPPFLFQEIVDTASPLGGTSQHTMCLSAWEEILKQVVNIERSQK